MLFNGLEVIAYNLNRQRQDLKLFEFGKTYHNYESAREEFKHLTIFVTGNRVSESWKTTSQPSDFFYTKGILKAMLDRLGISNYKEAPVKNDVFSEGVSLALGKIRFVVILTAHFHHSNDIRPHFFPLGLRVQSDHNSARCAHLHLIF